jgi:hypothetical protein
LRQAENYSLGYPNAHQANLLARCPSPRLIHLIDALLDLLDFDFVPIGERIQAKNTQIIRYFVQSVKATRSGGFKPPIFRNQSFRPGFAWPER